MIDALVPRALQGVKLYETGGESIFALPVAFSLIVGAVIAWLNHRGTREIAVVQSWLTFGKIFISLAFFACAAQVGHWENLEPRWGPAHATISGAGLWAVFATAPFFLAGFDVIPLAMGEKSVETSRRAVYFAIVGSVAAAVLYYALVILSGASLLPREELLGANLPAIAAF